MRNGDANTRRDDLRAKIQQAVKDGDTQAFYQAFDEMVQCIGEDVLSQATEQIQAMQQAADTAVLTGRGVRQLDQPGAGLLSEGHFCHEGEDPKQALNNLGRSPARDGGGRGL